MAVLIAGMFSYANAGDRPLRLKVLGMHCKLCAFKVKQSLRGLKQIENVQVDVKEGIVTLRIKEGEAVSDEELMRAISDSGYVLNTVEHQ